MMATSEDYRYLETDGGSAGLRTRFMHRYMDQVLQLATQSILVRRTLLRAFSMLVPPTVLFHPQVLFRVVLNVCKPVVWKTEASKDKSVPSRDTAWVSDKYQAHKRHLNSIG